MSDTEDEPFDKEAEREKLRQQLAQEEEARQSTQHMSELLLKGATMTNHHCDECGDPLFRHEGREFCPTCGRQRTADATAGSEAQSQGADVEDGADREAAAPDSAGGQPGAGDQPTAPDGTQPTGQPGSSTVQARAQYTGEADLPAAREALARKVTALAREAEATTDVGRARELLAAVREGAEALRALEGTGR